MQIRDELILGSLQSAQQRELQTSDSELATDLATLITPDVLEDGFAVYFDGDPQSFDRALGYMGIYRAVNGKNPDVHMHNVSIQRAQATSFLGRAIPILKKLNPIAAAEVLQAEAWNTYKEHEMYDQLEVDGREVTSRILYANTKLIENDEVHTEFGSTGIVIGARFTYKPEFDDFTEGFTNLAKYIRNVRDNLAGSRDNVPTQLAADVYFGGVGIKMPGCRYFVRYGRVAGRSLIGFSFCDVAVSAENKFRLQEGRVIPTERSQDVPIEQAA